MIRVENLSHIYSGASREAVSDVSFTIDKGQIFGFLGPSGAGKSTVQNIMIGLLPLQRGCVDYAGKTIKEYGKAFYNRIGVSFEHPNLYDKLTALENLEYYLSLFSYKKALPAEQLLEMVGLGDAKHKRAGNFSKGMKQRLVFARAISHQPDILFLDEPTSGLDPVTAARIKQIILNEKRRGATIFLTTHNMAAADELCDVVAFLNDGKIVAQDSPRHLKLAFGEKALKVEYVEAGELKTELLFIEQPADRARLSFLVDSGRVETLHSQEATLEQIFIKLTGRGLS